MRYGLQLADRLVLKKIQWLTAENITPSITARYTNQEIIAALTKPRGVSPVIGCSGPNRDELREVWYHFRVLGPLQSGKFEAQEPDFSGPGRASISCPPTGIKWFPKGYIPPIGDVSKGQLRVRLAQGSTHGCVIRAGVWFNTIGSGCATFTASTEGASSPNYRYLYTNIPFVQAIQSLSDQAVAHAGL